MDTKEFVSKIKRLHRLQATTLKFASEAAGGIVGLARLHGLVSNANGVIRYGNQSDHVVVLAVLQSRNWGGSRNQNVTVFGLSTADEEMLAQIARDVEHIEQPDHPAKGIGAKRQRSREEALDVLRDTVLPHCQSGALQWDLNLTFEALDDNGFTVGTFVLKSDDQALGSIGVDGWSGRIVMDGALSDKHYVGPIDLADLISDMIENAVDQLTAA